MGTPLLLVSSIETDPKHPAITTGHLLLGGRMDRVSIDLTYPSLIGYAETPDLLERHIAAHKAVVALLMQHRRGERIPMPVDLSDIVRESSEAWPVPLEAVDSRAESSLSIRVRKVTSDASEPDRSTIELDFGGVPTVVVVDQRETPPHRPRFRFASGVHPWQLETSEQRALYKVLEECLPRSDPIADPGKR